MELVAEASGPGATAGVVTEAGATGMAGATGPQDRGGRLAAEATDEVAVEVTEVDTEVDTVVGTVEAKSVGARLAGARARELGATAGEALENSRGLVQAGGQWWAHPGMLLRRKLRCWYLQMVRAIVVSK